MLIIDAGLRQAKPPDGPPVYEVFLHDFFRVLRFYKPIPDGLRIHDDHGPVLALVQAGGLVHAHAVLQSCFLYGVFQGAAQLFRVLVATAWARGGLVALVQTDKNVMFVIRHPVPPIPPLDADAATQMHRPPCTALPHLRE